MIQFKDIKEYKDENVQKILRELGMEDLACALINTGEDIKEKIFKNMSERAVNILKEEIDKYSKMTAKELLIELHQCKIAEIMKDTGND